MDLKGKLNTTCPNHIIVLEIPISEGGDASSSALKATTAANVANSKSNNAALTAKSPVDILKNSKHPLSVSIYD